MDGQTNSGTDKWMDGQLDGQYFYPIHMGQTHLKMMIFQLFLLKHNRPIDQWTDGRTDIPSYRDVIAASKNLMFKRILGNSDPFVRPADKWTD